MGIDILIFCDILLVDILVITIVHTIKIYIYIYRYKIGYTFFLLMICFLIIHHLFDA